MTWIVVAFLGGLIIGWNLAIYSLKAVIADKIKDGTVEIHKQTP